MAGQLLRLLLQLLPRLLKCLKMRSRMKQSSILWRWSLDSGQLALDAPEYGATVYIRNDSYLCAARGTLSLPEFIGMIYKFLSVYKKML